MSKIESLPVYRYLRLFTLLATVIAITTQLLARAENPSRDQMRKTLDRLFEQNVRDGTTVVAPGVQAYTRVPLSNAAFAEISAFGRDVLPVLSEYLSSPRIRFQELSLRCIALLGGPDAVKPLEAVALSSRPETVRLEAVYWLGSLPGENATSALKEIARSGNSQIIAEQARELFLQRSREK